MKKIFNIFIILFLISTSISFTYANDDEDWDWIINSEDSCPWTELWDVIDNSWILIWCSENQKNQDYDNDGISNRNDTCPGTKLWKNQTVIEIWENAWCTSQQVVLKIKKNDIDSDWIINDNDTCPDTPYWESHMVGTDWCTIEKDAEKWYNSNIYWVKSNTNKNLDTWIFENWNDIENQHLDVLWWDDFFSVWSFEWDKWILYFILKIAKDLKNIFFFIAWLFLFILVLNIFFSSNTEEEIWKFKKWLIWTSIWVIIMQLAYSITDNLYNRDIEQSTAATFLENIIYPIIWLLELLASLIFIIIAIFAFFRIVTAWWDEEKIKKWKTSVIQAIIWYIVLKLSWLIVSSVYWTVDCNNALVLWFEFVSNKCLTESEISGTVAIIVDVINWINWFLWIVVVLMIIYAWFNILLSWWDEDKIKKWKSVILYVIIWLLLLTTSYLILTFFILPEANI